MYAGALDTKVTIYRNEAVQGATGFTSDGWVEVCTRRAQVVSQKGGKALNNGSVWYPTARVVKMRKPLEIDESYRLLIDGIFYEIVNIDRTSDRFTLTISAQEVHES